MKLATRAELRRSANLRTRFVVSMTLALGVVLTIAGFALYEATSEIAESSRSDALSHAARLGLDQPDFEPVGTTAIEDPSGVRIFPVRYGDPPREGTIYQARRPDPGAGGELRNEVLVPAGEPVGRQILGLIVGMLVFVLIVGAVVALLVAGQVVRPIHELIEDVRQIAMGDLSHRTRTRGGGEVRMLGRAIDQMTLELSEAQQAKLALSTRDRELDLAASVRESLLPLTTPVVAGYDFGAAFLSSPHFGGDFHDFVELADGRVGLLACDVSGRGVPAALVGSTARAYMRSELARGTDLADSLRRINRWLAADVLRGMYVTALYALIDPGQGRAQVACAGHKIPVLRYTAADGRLRGLHPEGIALGLDKGPVFDLRLQLRETPLEPGDRLLLANSAPVRIKNPAGAELGEKALFGRVLKHAHLETQPFLKALKRDFEQFAGEGGVPFDVSLVTIARVS